MINPVAICVIGWKKGRVGQGDQVTYCNRQKVNIASAKLASLSITKKGLILL